MDAIFRPDLTRIVLTGSESTGKTTLAAQLATHYHVEWVPEFVREFAQNKNAPIEMADHDAIARGQLALEEAYASRAKCLLIQDADLLSTVAYCHHYFGSCATWIEAEAIARRPNLYLLADIDVPWAADGVRDRGEQRDEMHALFVNTLTRLHARFRVLTGLGPARLQNAIALIDGLLRSGQL